MRATPSVEQKQSPERFRKKLGSYLTGVAIGFVLLGFFAMKKNQAVEAQNSEMTAPQEQPESGIVP